MTATGPIATFGAITGGAAGTNGVYKSVPLTGGSGKLAFADVTVAGAAVTALAFTDTRLDRTGMNYQVGDTLSAASANIGGVTGFSVPVATLAAACENCFYSRIIPPYAEASLAGQRYCGNQAYLNQGGGPLNWGSLNARNIGNLCSDDYWCGDGADLVSGQSFEAAVGSLPTPHATTWYTGAGAPAAGLGTPPDLYLNTANADVYQKGGTGWTLIVNIKGATGATGATGANGTNGTNGTNGIDAPQVYLTTVVNGAGTGNNGDLDIVGPVGGTIAGNVYAIYKKIGGVWTLENQWTSA